MVTFLDIFLGCPGFGLVYQAIYGVPFHRANLNSDDKWEPISMIKAAHLFLSAAEIRGVQASEAISVAT